ncbi:uncharacterized protein LOC143539322 [Bidens hawaiensis]|uniref:uncharacterized protein LOC143539322 n=1 Tax=Bidens hawaiensis TaxID=980011 RepID=UPI00404AF1D3
MDSVSPVNEELEQQLKEAGEHLASPHSSSSVNNLINLIDKTKQLLARVGQAPSISMQKALVPSMGALIADELIKHSETDVKISVASCLCEVVRITAPDQTYEDEVMKKIFKLYVLAFEQLSNVTGQSYHKVIHILQSVAKVKSFLLMLDLECDALVFEMFEQFLSKIRIDHPRTVFSDIETIMSMIIEESDEISIELLSLLISRAKKENQMVSPASWKLAEKVLKRCNTLIKELINANLDDYAEVVTLICQNGHENEHLGTRSTSRINSTHKRDLITLDNDRSTKKQKYTDNNRFKTPKRGRPKKNDIPSLGLNSQKGTARTRVLDQRQSSKTKGNTKNSGSDNGADDKDDIPKKWKEDLAGHMIKVWWPLDKVYYEGVVASYDPLNGKYKVLYADGDEELLDLNEEKWRMVDKTSVDQKAKRNRESSRTQEDNSTSPKRTNSTPPADSSKTEDVICNVDNKDNLAPTPAVSHELIITEKITDNVEKNDESKRINSPPPADISKTEDVICNVDNKDNPAPTPAAAVSHEFTITEKITDNVEKNGESKRINSPPPVDSSKTDNVVCNVDNKNNPAPAPAISHELTITETINDNVEKNGESKRIYSPPPADSSKTGDVISNADNQKDNPASTPAISDGLTLAEKTIDNMEKNGESNPSGELQEKSLLESSEATQGLEKTDSLVSES